MATWQARVADYTTNLDPPADATVEVLCQDHVGTYAVPFLCRLEDGTWVNDESGKPVLATVVGWRVPKRRRP